MKNIFSILLVLVLVLTVGCTSTKSSFQLKSTASGYDLTGFSQELLDDFDRLPKDEKLAVSLVDPELGESKVSGSAVHLDKGLELETEDRFEFEPVAERTFLVLELANSQGGGSDCAGCTLTNRNLKSRTPQICWCFSIAAPGANPEG